MFSDQSYGHELFNENDVWIAHLFSSVNASAFKNLLYILVTLDTSQEDISSLNVVSRNNLYISVIRDTYQDLIGTYVESADAFSDTHRSTAVCNSYLVCS